MRWNIWAPPYVPTSGGIRVLYRLAWWLNQLGESVAIVFFGSILVEDGVAVYPEIVLGNPWGAAQVIRYVMNVPGRLGGETEYAASEIVIAQQARWQPETAKAAGHDVEVVYFSCIDPAIFYPGADEGRVCDAIFVYKGAPEYEAAGRACHEVPGIPMIPIGGGMSDANLAALLRRCDRFVTYDHQTSLMAEARICGASVCLADRTGLTVYSPTHFMHEVDHERNVEQWSSPAPVLRMVALARERLGTT